MSGVALGWGLIVHHVAVHAVFHIAIRFALKIGGRLMDQVTKMVTSMKNVPSIGTQRTLNPGADNSGCNNLRPR
jgi:hypothetical protein